MMALFVSASSRADTPAASAQTPELVLTGALAWEDRGRSAAVQVRHVGSQFEEDRNQQLLPSATAVDAFGAWPLTRRLQLTARLQNLFDNEIIAGENDDGTRERATPRTMWIGVRFNASIDR